ncbi:MAG: site-2 protease family protein [Thermoplasmatota archaeon]
MAIPDLRAVVERHFRVYEAREERHGGEVAARIFCVMFPAGEFDRRFGALQADVKAVDPGLMAFMRRDGGEDVLYIARKPPPAPRDTALTVTLFVLTILTTTMAGVLYWHGYAKSRDMAQISDFWDPSQLGMGLLTFALPLALILGAHEAAHAWAAKRHGLKPGFPKFIPFPPVPLPIGTLGAWMNTREAMSDRKALFDVGASGPIAGFIVALPLLLLGMHLTGATHQPIPDFGHPDFTSDRSYKVATSEGKSVLNFTSASPGIFSFTVHAPAQAQGSWSYSLEADTLLTSGNTTSTHLDGRLDPGKSERRTLTIPPNATAASITVTWDSGLIHFGDPLVVQLVDRVWPTNDNFLTHPTFFAAWVGMLLTGIQLLPVGQLDGGHVARALFGDRMRYVAWVALAVLAGLSLWGGTGTWVLIGLFLIILGVGHAPPLNERTGLGRARVAVAVGLLALFLLTFVVRPIF